VLVDDLVDVHPAVAVPVATDAWTLRIEVPARLVSAHGWTVVGAKRWNTDIGQHATEWSRRAWRASRWVITTAAPGAAICSCWWAILGSNQ
jgi:hypothetical protein